MLKNRFLACSILIINSSLLAGCGGSSLFDSPSNSTPTTLDTKTSFLVPTSNSSFSVTDFDSEAEGYIKDGEDGVGYAVGIIDNFPGSDEYAGYAGLHSSTTVSELPSQGTAVMKGEVELAEIYDIKPTISGSSIFTGSFYKDEGVISLTADFGAGTLKGNSGSLYVDGKFTSKDLGGNVTYKGVAGDLTGLIDGNKAIGAFHGKTSTSLYAGGFLVKK